jgi:hypothetical protein
VLLTLTAFGWLIAWLSPHPFLWSGFLVSFYAALAASAYLKHRP